MPRTAITSASPFSIVVDGETSAGQVSADLTPAGLGVTASTAAAEAAQATADAALAAASEVWITAGTFSSQLGSASPASMMVPAPVSGTLSRILVAATDAPDADIVVATSIGGTPVTGGSATLDAGRPGGTVAITAPTAGNVVAVGTTAVLVTPTTTNTTSLRFTVVLGFTRAP